MKEQILSRFFSGKSPQEIAKELDLTCSKVYAILDYHGTKVRTRNDDNGGLGSLSLDDINVKLQYLRGLSPPDRPRRSSLAFAEDEAVVRHNREHILTREERKAAHDKAPAISKRFCI